MNRKLTEKERNFLKELRELMYQYNVLLGTEDDRVSIDLDYDEDSQESVILPNSISSCFDLDDFIEQNS